uniref:hypothetical protein n=1 Tax=Pseudomonas viridiflava TaxID=33069 RepID=UPI0019D148AA
LQHAVHHLKLGFYIGLGCLLVTVSDCQQSAFGPAAAEEIGTGRQAILILPRRQSAIEGPVFEYVLAEN